MDATSWKELTRSYTVWDDNNIKGFFGEEYRWLSNFYLAPVQFDGLIYPSSEHAYQAAKTKNVEKRVPFSDKNLSAKAVKKMGSDLVLRTDWEDVKDRIMFLIVLDKFYSHWNLRDDLLATKDKYLEETNHWGDKYWGVDYKTGIGRNQLGITLMAVRSLMEVL